jgi:hypothetical protein
MNAEMYAAQVVVVVVLHVADATLHQLSAEKKTKMCRKNCAHMLVPAHLGSLAGESSQ